MVEPCARTNYLDFIIDGLRLHLDYQEEQTMK